MADLQLSPPVFAILSSLIEDKVGLSYSVEDCALLAGKISWRAAEAGFDSALDYYYFLRYDDPEGREFQALVDSLVVNETYFFREFDQLEMMLSTFIEPLVAAGGRPRVWSAACSTGEEPLTIAMLLEERGLLGSVDLVASDISTSALSRARKGRFSRRSLRNVPRPALVERWLSVERDAVTIDPWLIRSIEWRQVNLLDTQNLSRIGEFDAIVCRNVLIYFRDEVAQTVVTSLANQLRPQGALFVGVSESLMRLATSLVCEEHRGTFAYRRAKP